ncbi:hypothetical protein RND71_012324 [Anisodus tanguticus]|uniref:Uncharacterized protein n=1 Tax=Anisodus tanguticus TaxID=243964 RepID=A0AAE1SF96_9SOLA|nr:hypothetical protein RND71_012324 [Anisodus tanguticus]
MDEIGVHSLRMLRNLLYRIDTTSPANGCGKDLSNPLTAVTLPKSENEEATSSKTRRKLPQTITGSTSGARSKRDKEKTTKEHRTGSTDPNDAYDSGMSFDSVALHNLDT